MTKEERNKGEEILRKWARAKGRLMEIQREIKLIKDKVSPIFIQDSEENEEILKTYKEVLSEMLNEMKKNMLEYKNVEDIINGLEKFERNIIIYRYQKKYSWDRIAMENHISRTNCFNIKNRVIKELIKEN